MPPQPNVSHEKLLEALIQGGPILLPDGAVPPPSSQIWKDISQSLDSKVTPKNVYTQVLQNRSNLLHKIKDKEGHTSHTDNKRKYREDDEDEWKEEEEKMGGPQLKFRIVIPAKEWQIIKPIEKIRKRKDCPQGTRTNLVLPADQWANIICRLIWEQHKIPCVYTFHTSRVNKDPALRENFIIMEANCKDCGAKAKGVIIDEPHGDGDVELWWHAPDTRKIRHYSKRFLSGDERSAIGKELRNQLASNYRLEKARDTMDFGDPEPPFLYKGDVLRKAKEEYRNKEMGLGDKAGDGEYKQVANLSAMKRSEPYSGSIHQIGIDKFMVIYFTSSQMVIYNNYVMQNYSRIAIDATGSIVNKIKRPNSVSAHIFLYSIVIRTPSKFQISVAQMLSEMQDANIILYWCNYWQQEGAKSPNEIVTDGNKALVSACARSFAGVKDAYSYKELCFSYLKGETEKKPDVFLRNCIAHLINDIRKWNQWKTVRSAKDFIMRCIVLLAESKTLDDFRKILLNILTLCYNEFYGLLEGKETPAENSQKYLAQLIAGNKDVQEYPIDQDKSEETSEVREGEEEGEEEEEEEEEEAGKGKPSSIKEWIQDVQLEAKNLAKIKGDRVCPYFSKPIGDKICKICRNFVLWSAVMVGPFNSPYPRASTATVESDFANLKTRVLRNENLPMSIDKFVSLHLNAIDGQTKICQANVSLDDEADTGDPSYSDENLGSNMETEQHNSLPALENQRNIPVNLINKNLGSNMETEQPNSLPTLENQRNIPVDLINKNLGSNMETEQHNLLPALENQKNIPSRFYSVVSPYDFQKHIEEPISFFQLSDQEDDDKESSSSLNLNSAGDEYEDDDDDMSSSLSLKISSDVETLELYEKFETLVDLTGINESQMKVVDVDDAEKKRHDSPVNREVPEDSSASSSSDEEWKERSPFDLNFLENWRGLAKKGGPPKSREPLLIKKCPEILAAQSAGLVKQPRQKLLVNGNIKGYVKVDKKIQVEVVNTCTFDAVCQILVQGYVDNEKFREEVQESENLTLQVVGSLATVGAVEMTYIKRAIALKEAFPEAKTTLPLGKTRGGVQYESYDVWSNSETMLKKLFSDLPSVKMALRCTSETCTFTETHNDIVAFTTATMLAEFGLSSLEDAIHNYYYGYQIQEKRCPTCGLEVQHEYCTGKILFVSIDLCHQIRKRKRWKNEDKIEECPTKIKVFGNSYSLIGLVDYVNGNHYVAYTRRIRDNWDYYNDLEKKPTLNVKTNRVITPHVLIYVQIDLKKN